MDKFYKMTDKEEIDNYLKLFKELTNAEANLLVSLINDSDNAWLYRAISHNTWVSPVIQGVVSLFLHNLVPKELVQAKINLMNVQYMISVWKTFFNEKEVIISKELSIYRNKDDDIDVVLGTPPLAFFKCSDTPTNHLVIENDSEISEDLKTFLPEKYHSITNFSTFNEEKLTLIKRTILNDFNDDGNIGYFEKIDIWFKTTFLNKSQFDLFNVFKGAIGTVHVLTKNDVEFDNFKRKVGKFGISVKRLK